MCLLMYIYKIRQKKKRKRKNPFHWTYAIHVASFTFKNILYAYKDKLQWMEMHTDQQWIINIHSIDW